MENYYKVLTSADSEYQFAVEAYESSDPVEYYLFTKYPANGYAQPPFIKDSKGLYLAVISNDSEYGDLEKVLEWLSENDANKPEMFFEVDGNWPATLSELMEKGSWEENDLTEYEIEQIKKLKVGEYFMHDHIKIERTEKFLNHYECEDCDIQWSDEWSCACNDKCSSCNAEIEPYKSEQIS